MATVPTLTSRGYEIDGRVLPRVSTILNVIAKEGLLRWKLKVGEDEARRISEASSAFGTRVHAACEQINRGDEWLPEADDADLVPYATAYQGWLAANVVEVVACERIVYSLAYGYGGTLDMLLRLRDGRLVLGDLKTSKSLSETYRLQLAAYALALEEIDGIQINGRLVLHLPSDRPGTLRAVEYDRLESDRYTWQCCVQLYRFLQRHKDDWKATAQPIGGAE